MTWVVFAKLAALLLTVASGFAVGRLGWLGGAEGQRAVGFVALYLFIPALLFRTAARVDLASLPPTIVLALFVPVVVLMLLHYAWQRRRAPGPAAGPGVRTVAGGFGNTVQVGIPLATALFGEPGLAIHITLASLHALVLLSTATLLTELALSRGRTETPLAQVLLGTVRNTVVHPVVLPVVLGLAANLAGLPLPDVVDDALVLLGSGTVPLCLVLIGLALAHTGVAGHLAAVAELSVIKLLLQPGIVLAFAHQGLGLRGLPLQVVVVMAALPVGSNALIFAQRYRVHEAEAGAAIVLSTLAFPLTALLWLAVLALLG